MCHKNGEEIRVDGSSSCAGFTLLELVLATLISSLVIAIMSVSLGFSLRLWERNQNRQPDDTPRLIELLRWQLANFDPVRISTEETKELIFRGDEHSLVFATDRSVRAISGGAPVIVRYVFVPSERLLYYAEIPLDPYHGDILDKFIEMKPADSGSLPRFYPTPMDSFSLSFGQGEEKAGVTKSWDDPEAIPLLVLVNWSRDGGATSSTQLMIPNSFFPRKIKEDKVVSPSEAGNQGLAPDR